MPQACNTLCSAVCSQPCLTVHRLCTDTDWGLGKAPEGASAEPIVVRQRLHITHGCQRQLLYSSKSTPTQWNTTTRTITVYSLPARRSMPLPSKPQHSVALC